MRRFAHSLSSATSRRARGFERAIGAERPGRSPWVWLGPAINVAAPYVLFLTHFGEVDIWARLAIATVAALFMGGMSVAYLAAFAADARDASADEGGVPSEGGIRREEVGDVAPPGGAGEARGRPLQPAGLAGGPAPAADRLARGAERR
jgi:hypothetical protein